MAKILIADKLSDEGVKIVDEVGTSLALTKEEREKVLKVLNEKVW